MLLAPNHVIWTRDAGSDGWEPGRWQAWAQWVGVYGFGNTEEDAVADCRAKLAREMPGAFWVSMVPARRLPLPDGSIPGDGGER